ncbi:hypothetical protein GCM10017776_07320 [Streptomyces griseoluteus]|nr:hypothetical protein GCM10017776_07320 [Streptomyces griseoluteus]
MVTRTEVSEALDRVMEALAGLNEEEASAALAPAGASVPRPSAPSPCSQTPLPGPGSSAHIFSGVEWV